MIIPKDSVKKLLSVLGDSEEVVKVMLVGEKQIAFKMANSCFYARALTEEFPDITGIIPQSFKTRVTVNTRDWRDILNRAALLSEGKNMTIKIAIQGQEATFSVQSELGTMNERLDLGNKEGEDVDICINAMYLLDAFKAVSSDKATIEFNGERGPCIVRSGGNYLCLILPVVVGK